LIIEDGQSAIVSQTSVDSGEPVDSLISVNLVTCRVVDNSIVTTRLCMCINQNKYIQGGTKKLAQFFYALTLSNKLINRYLKLFYCQNQEKICNNTITRDPTTHQVCRYTTLEVSLSEAICRSVSLFAPLVSGVAGLSASASSKADTLNM